MSVDLSGSGILKVLVAWNVLVVVLVVVGIAFGVLRRSMRVDVRSEVRMADIVDTNTFATYLVTFAEHHSVSMFTRQQWRDMDCSCTIVASSLLK